MLLPLKFWCVCVYAYVFIGVVSIPGNGKWRREWSREQEGKVHLVLVVLTCG